MKSMKLHIRRVMVSLSALGLLAPAASFVSLSAAAQQSHEPTPAWSMSRTGTRALPPAAPDSHAANPAVPRGDLRGDIASNARRSAPPRQEPAQHR
ncbi:hypothetical protein VSR34_25190 [Paraburkholderia sp. JHI2823]|uniref:hypothetical protein n=1 Tax=Paraburkholderia TaxID=1822464 RepID=UPI0012DFC4E6|nr:hypothetical protein [Paraburkholderia mimosarum]